jgi:two-component system, sensor histidine kinase and response regulator
MSTPVANLLLVEDDDAIRETTADLLQLCDFNVVTARSGREAAELLARQQVDIVVSDVVMPDGDGLGLLEHIRSSPALRLLPVILLSARAEKADIQHGMAHGADDYLTKPFQTDDLIAAIHRQLRRSTHGRNELEGLKARIARAIPHELRTPLDGLVGHVEILAEAAAKLPEGARAEIEGIQASLQTSARTLLRLVERLELWIELQSHPGRILHAAQTASPFPWTGGVIARCRNLAAAEGRAADLTVELEETPVAMPPRYLGEMVFALADNALRFSTPGSPVAVQGRVENGRYRLTVRSRGLEWHPGGAPGEDPFLRYDRDIACQRGLGLGLAIALKVADLLGAETEFARRDDLTIARFALPLQAEIGKVPRNG